MKVASLVSNGSNIVQAMRWPVIANFVASICLRADGCRRHFFSNYKSGYSDIVASLKVSITACSACGVVVLPGLLLSYVII